MRALVTIRNPNPRILAVWQGPRLIDTLRPKQEVLVAMTAELRLTYEGKRALVYCLAHSDDEGFEDAEWIQEVTSEPTPVHPDRALEKASDD